MILSFEASDPVAYRCVHRDVRTHENKGYNVVLSDVEVGSSCESAFIPIRVPTNC